MKHRRIMLVLSDRSQLLGLTTLAQRMVSNTGEICVRGLVSVAEGTSLSEGVGEVREWRDALDEFFKQHPIRRDEDRVYVDYRPMQRVFEELTEQPADLLIVQWMGLAVPTGGLTTDEIIEAAACDLVLIAAQNKNWEGVEPVLLSLRGGPNLTLGLQVAKALANDEGITLFHVMQELSAPEGANLEVVMRAEPQVTRSVSIAAGVAEGILRESTYHKAVVLGAGLRQIDEKRQLNTKLIEHLSEQIRVPLALVRAYYPGAMQFHPPYVIEPKEDDLSTRVDRWFAQNTFHSREFADLEALLELKQKQDVTISIGLPALNEEATVGKVIQTLKTAFMEQIPLVDEIVVIDSESTDNTVAIAEGLGVPVYRHPEILAEMGSYRGKGEALWKSLHVLKGDIIAWIDTDITNIHPRFIYGIIGPLLKYPRLQYVKGFYQRPIKVGDKLQAYGGGRVTELVARPLINLFYPELSGIVQPLSGEYAGRRAALERVPFFTGYGVETGLLIDLYERFGLEAIAQSDLEVRIHHNQPLVNLSKMSFAIHQVFIDRIEKRYDTRLLERVNRSMKLIVHEPERFGLEIQAISDVERPPMIELARYRDCHSA